MNYKILKDGELVNTIVADEAFCVSYCEANGYTYELLPEPEPTTEEIVEEPSADELLKILAGVTG